MKEKDVSQNENVRNCEFSSSCKAESKENAAEKSGVEMHLKHVRCDVCVKFV